MIGKVSGSVKTQLIAHDKEVHDIAFTRAGGGRDLFASVGSDGSVRMFDLRLVVYHSSGIVPQIDCYRNLEHSTILYEDSKQLPLLRLSWNKQDPNYLATFSMDSTEV